MDHGQLSMMADKFQWVFSEPLLNACGTDVKFCQRQRVITPFRLGLALTATCASQRVETIADLHCGFNALFGTTVTYKAFYNQVAKPHLADFARLMAERLISEMTLKVPDFSVVLFRPNFMLASEEHPMKAHKNQWLLALPSPLTSLVGS